MVRMTLVSTTESRSCLAVPARKAVIDRVALVRHLAGDGCHDQVRTIAIAHVVLHDQSRTRLTLAEISDERKGNEYDVPSTKRESLTHPTATLFLLPPFEGVDSLER